MQQQPLPLPAPATAICSTGSGAAWKSRGRRWTAAPPRAPSIGGGTSACRPATDRFGKQRAGASAVCTDAEGRFEVVLAVRPKGDQRRCGGDAIDLVQPPGDHIGEFLVPTDPHHRDKIDVAGYRIDL